MKRDLFFPGLAALLLLALGLMLPGLGTGIWDPWEMDRAHLARQMVGRTKLLVVEQGGGLGDALRRSAGERFFVDNAAEGRPATRPPGQPEGAQAVPVAGGQTLKKAARVLTEGSFHGLLVHESALGDAAAAAAFLDEVSASHPGVAAALVASSRDACDRLVTELEEAMVTATAALLTGGYGLLEPGLDRDALAARWGGTYPFQLHVPCLALDEAEDPAALVGWMDGIQWSRVLARAALAPQEKGGKAPGTGNFGVPPLDHWLTALSYRALGFSETSSRLPGVLLGLLTMAILGLGLRRLAGPRVALLSVAVLLTVPMFLGQSKNMAGEISYTCFLSGGVLAFALMIREGLRAGWLLGFVAAATLLFLSKGLFGLGVLWLVAGSYVLVLGDRRPAALVPWAVLTAGLGVLAALVLVPSEWTFFSHFRFMNHPVNGGPNAYSSWFDFFLRQVGFGAFPWTILLPFAVGALAARLQDDDAAGEERRLAGLLFLWFTVPFVIHAAGMTDFRHLVFPAIPALGAAVALFWLREGEARERPLANGLVAVGVAGVAAVVLQALLKSREPAVNWLTVDPMLSARTAQGAEDASLLGPEARVILALLVLLTFLHHARLSAAVQGVLGVFRRRAPFRIAAWLLGVAFVLKTLGVLADRFGGPTPQKAAGLVDPRILDLPRHLLLHRVDHLLLAGLLGILGLAAFLGGTATGRRVAAVASRVLALPGLRRITAGHRIPPAGGHSGPSPVLLLPGLGLLAWGLLNLVVTFPALPELPAGSLFQGPFPVAAMALAAGLTAAALVSRRRLPAGAAFQAAAAGAALVLLTFAGRLQAATDGSHWDAPLLLALGTAGWAAALVPWLCRSPGLLHGVAAGLGLWLALSVTTPLLQGWNVLEAVVYPEADPPLRRYLFAGSRTTLLLYAAAIGLAANRVAGWLWDRIVAPRGPAGLRWLRPVAWIEAVERPAVHRIAALALAGIFAGVFALGILPGFSREVSQKHILDTYLAAEGRGSIGDNLFKFSPENGGGDDRNFYTAPLPALGSQNDLLDVLTLGVDRAFKVRRSSSHPGPETLMVRAWSEANDGDGDGTRDFVADAGIATGLETTAEGTILEDSTRDWEPDRWVGHQLFDARGRGVDVLSNDATRLTLGGVPALEPGNPVRGLYRIDHPAAADHMATAVHRSRSFVVMGQEGFSETNFKFRKKTRDLLLKAGDPGAARRSPPHIPVIEGDNINFLLAASHLEDGEVNENPFAKATLTREEFDGLEGVQRLWVDLDGQIRLLGYRLSSGTYARGQKLKLDLYFECTAAVTRSWKIFMHIDAEGSGNRINGDHWPLNRTSDPEGKECVGCWKTSNWMEGDIIVDHFETEVPLGTPSGRQNLWMGFYLPSGGTRLKVKDWDRRNVRHDGSDRFRIGHFEVR